MIGSKGPRTIEEICGPSRMALVEDKVYGISGSSLREERKTMIKRLLMRRIKKLKARCARLEADVQVLKQSWMYPKVCEECFVLFRPHHDAASFGSAGLFPPSGPGFHQGTVVPALCIRCLQAKAAEAKLAGGVR